MGISKNIKNYFKKKAIVKSQLDHSIPNFNNYNTLNKTIVFINGGMPTPDKDSGSNRLTEIILAYKEQGYNCIICTKNAYRNDKYINYFSNLGIIIYVETNRYKNYFEFLKSIPKVDFVWYYSPNTLKDNLKKISEILPNSKSIFDMVDIHFLRYQRALKLEPGRISFIKKQKKYFKIETKLAQKADYIITISDIEKEIMAQYINAKKLITISNIHYPKIKKEDTLPFEQRADLLFIGSGHTPNIDALYYLYNDIMPLVWKKIPEVKVNIIGNVNNEISDISHHNFIFIGYVPDIESYFINNKIMVAPLRYGAGVKGKIGQAFEYYLPVITTSIGAEGMTLKHNENAILEDTCEGFANAIIELHTNKELWERLQNNSEKSLQPFSKDILKQTLLTL
jgi:glycosyltransferase involved in cell wall biosynthesis